MQEKQAANPQRLEKPDIAENVFFKEPPAAAPEIILHDGRYYIASLMPSLEGIQIARLKWVKK